MVFPPFLSRFPQTQPLGLQFPKLLMVTEPMFLLVKPITFMDPRVILLIQLLYHFTSPSDKELILWLIPTTEINGLVLD